LLKNNWIINVSISKESVTTAQKVEMQIDFAFFAGKISVLYKTAFILYIVCFLCYVLFSRVPDYFEGELTRGIVAKATFSVKEKHPVLVVNYQAGNEKRTYTTNKWFLTRYKPGQVITLIYNPSDPAIVSIYAVMGYWIQWDELLFTAIGFIILFIAAVIITGKGSALSSTLHGQNKKRKYDED